MRLSLFALVLTACVFGKPEDTGPDLTTDVVSACEGYFTEVNTCYAAFGESSGVDTSALTLDLAYCAEEFDGEQDAEAVAYLDCLAEEYRAADCADPDSFGGIDFDHCVPPGGWEERFGGDDDDDDTDDDTEFDR